MLGHSSQVHRSVRIVRKSGASILFNLFLLCSNTGMFPKLFLHPVTLLFLSLLLVISYICLLIWRNLAFYRKISRFPTRSTVPLFGNMFPVLFSSKGRVETMLELVAEYDLPKPFVFWLFYLPLVVVSSYEDIQIVSNRSFWRNARGKFKMIVGDGIALSHPDKWRNVRRMINPAFGPAMLQQYFIVFNEQAEILCRRLDQAADTGKMVDIFLYMGDLNLDIITKNMAGFNLQVQEKGDNNEFAESLATSLRLESSRFFEPWLYPDTFYYLYLLFTGRKDLYKKLHKMPSEVIKRKLVDYKIQKEKLKICNGPVVDKPVKTFIDILCRLQDALLEFTEQQMHDEILTMIAAGSESTAIVSSFTLLMLAIHQDAQEKVYQELVMAFGNDLTKKEIQVDDLNKLKYLEQCIKETLRKFTLAPIMFREATEDITLTNGEVVPTGAIVVMAYHLIHRDTDIYPDPDTWDPERFASENFKPTFIPFGTGARACIGSKYAMISLKTQLFHVLRRFHLSTNIKTEDIEIEYDLLIRKKGGYPIKLTSRNDSAKTLSS